MATERAQEVAGGIGLRTILCQAAQVHAVPATSGEGDGQLVCYGSRLQALQADTTTLVVGDYEGRQIRLVPTKARHSIRLPDSEDSDRAKTTAETTA